MKPEEDLHSSASTTVQSLQAASIPSLYNSSLSGDTKSTIATTKEARARAQAAAREFPQGSRIQQG